MSIGGGGSSTNPNNSGGEQFSSSSGSSNSQSSSFRDPQTVWGPQAGFLQQLYGMGMNQAGGSNARATGLYNQAAGGFNQLMNPGVNPQLQAYQGDVQRNFERNIMPTISGDAQGFGQMGGSRQGVAEGIAASDANQQVSDMAANLYGEDRDRMMQTMSMAPQLGMFGQNIPWYNMQQMGGLLGPATVLGGAAGSQSSGSSSSESSGYGYNYDVGGGSDSWNASLGFPTG